MKQVFISKGQALVEEIPAPQVEAGAVLVRVHHSCISIGTEMSGIKASGMPLWKRALSQPQKVKKAVQMLATKGLAHTRNRLQEHLGTSNPAGYSAAGVVLDVGRGVYDLRPGDRVACAGAQCAHHAEIIRVPRNLTVPIPGNLGFASASTVTLGAIALQGVRRAQPSLGETFVVIGLGILGQLAAQMLRANGCRVIGTDLDRERVRQAQKLGMEMGIHPDDGGDPTQVARLTDGIGADGVIITAATPSHAVMSTAFQMCRKKGRVVLVGDVGLHLNRDDFYQKELDFFISTSYGPGRYDRKFEEEGLDYPVGYVRWTENRNMAEYLRMLEEGKVEIESLISATYPVDQATSAYEALKSETTRPLMVLLSYPPPQEDSGLRRVIANPQAHPAGGGRIGIALVGAGGFAKGMHLPNLQKLADLYHLHAVMSRTGHNAAQTAKQFGASYATTDFQQVMRDPEVQAVIIATRHHLHAAMALEALQAGKHVLLEKPLALTREELEKIQEFFNSSSGEQVPVLLTGFNRRFSPCARRVHEIVADRREPMILRYRMNAGYIPLDNWVHGEEGGGRNLGEACHIYDLFTYLTGSRVAQVTAQVIKPNSGYYSPRDNFVANITFEDGSLASLTYTALGSSDYPKEQLEVYLEGKVLVLDDYRRLTIFGAQAKGIELKDSDKGQKEELADFARAIRDGGDWPIPFWQQVQATEIALAVDESISH